MNEGFKKFKQRKFGIKATPYTTPLRPSAGALDKKRFLLDKNVKQVHAIAEKGRAIMTELHRQVQRTQECEYVYHQLRARRLEYAEQEEDAILERAKAAAEAQARGQAISTTKKMTTQEIRRAAAESEEELSWDSDDLA